GDMLLSDGSGRLRRVHGAFVSDQEVEAVAAFLRDQGEPDYVAGLTEAPEDDEAAAPNAAEAGDLFDKAVAIVMRDRKASTSYLQRRLQIGYNRAADLIERMEADGLIGPADHAGRRDILMSGRDG
ncbi:MAG: DNA translocase FtsK, partial [Pseudomonadota bacterium]